MGPVGCLGQSRVASGKDGSNLEDVWLECLARRSAVPRVSKTPVLVAILSISILFLKVLGRPAMLGFGAQVDP